MLKLLEEQDQIHDESQGQEESCDSCKSVDSQMEVERIDTERIGFYNKGSAEKKSSQRQIEDESGYLSVPFGTAIGLVVSG